MTDRAKEVLASIYARRSVRAFVDGKPVEDTDIRLLLEAGMAAPSACNLQPWEYIVVTDPEALAKLRKIVTYGDYNAPMAIVMLGNTSGIPWKNEDWKIDCSAGVENMMLLATALGLGSVWLGSYDEPALRELLSIPENIHIMDLVYFGYPASEGQPKTRYNEEAVHYGKYDASRVRVMRSIGDPDNTLPR